MAFDVISISSSFLRARDQCGYNTEKKWVLASFYWTLYCLVAAKTFLESTTLSSYYYICLKQITIKIGARPSILWKDKQITI